MAKENQPRTQAEKSRQMRSRLFEATLDCLQKYGYHGTSLARILETANVSKGAWNHHFKSKKELIALAAESMLKQALEAGKKDIHNVAFLEEKDRIASVLSYYWKNYHQGKRRDVWIEVYTAVRTDAELREYLSPIIHRFHASLNNFWREHFVLTDRDSNTSIEVVMNLMLYLTRGMAIHSIVLDDPDYYRALRRQWTEMVKPLARFVTPGE